jgi:DNA-binding NarL/FixJ family response regulator
MAVIRLALVDDHAIVRSGIKSLLEKSEQFEIIHEASTADELLLFLSEGSLVPDMVLMDIKMPGTGALDATRFLYSNFPLIRIVIFSMIGQIDSIAEFISNGACGYISKACDTDNLARYLQSVMDGKRLVESPDKNLSVKALNSHLKIKPALSDHDKKFLALCATELSYEEIAVRLSISIRAVHGYRSKLFDLLDIKSRSGLVLYAIRNGIAE